MKLVYIIKNRLEPHKEHRLGPPLRPSGNYMNHLLWQSVMLHFVFIGFAWFPLQTAIISLNSVNQLIFVMVRRGVLFEVRTEFLNKM
jgi:D-alanyl-lipoteichoic acid acyltransferase DltB (MBOAT superfamily)